MNLISNENKIFVAGSFGMVGGALVRCLLKNNYKNIITSNRASLNLLDFDATDKFMAKNRPDVVIIAAAKVGGILANNNYPADFLLENIKIQTNLMEISRKYEVKRLLFLGSSCIYPKFAPQPIAEEELLSGYLEKTNESYALAKIAGIKLADSLRRQYNFDCISLMPTNLYGFGDNYNLENSHVVPAMIRKFQDAKLKGLNKVKCWGSGNPLRELLNVDDLANACIFALEKWDPSNSSSPKANNEELTYLNVGSEDELSIKNLAFLIAELVEYKGDIIWDNSKPDGTPRKKLNYDRFKKLGWSPSIDLSNGLQETINDYKKNYKDGLLRK